jgi:hypothetical protein
VVGPPTSGIADLPVDFIKEKGRKGAKDWWMGKEFSRTFFCP